MKAKTKKFHAFNDVPPLCVICLHMYWIKEKFLYMNSKKFIYYKHHMKLYAFQHKVNMMKII